MNISRRHAYWHTPVTSFSCINGKQEVELLLIFVCVFHPRARPASMCVRLHPCIMRATGEPASASNEIPTLSLKYIHVCACVRVRARAVCVCVLCVCVCPPPWQYPNLERKCIFEQRTLTRWPAQVNLCVCNSEKCVCVTLGDKVNGVFFSDEPLWIHEPGRKWIFIFFIRVGE